MEEGEEQEGIPYCWGGWDSEWTNSVGEGVQWNSWEDALETYEENGPITGNQETGGNYKAGTVGLDCSGFVSAANDAFTSKSGTGTIVDNMLNVDCENVNNRDGQSIWYSGIQPMDVFARRGEHILYYVSREDEEEFITLESTTGTGNDPLGEPYQGAKEYSRDFNWVFDNGYELGTWWEKEDGDDFDVAYTEPHSKTIMYGQSVYYEITNDVSSDITYNITVDPWEEWDGNPDLYLYNSDYEEITTSDNDGNEDETIEHTIPEGEIWYARVYGETEADSRYTISWENMLGDVNDDGEVNSLDVALLTNYFLTGENLPGGTVSADMSEDGRIDSLDFALLTNKVL